MPVNPTSLLGSITCYSFVLCHPKTDKYLRSKSNQAQKTQTLSATKIVFLHLQINFIVEMSLEHDF